MSQYLQQLKHQMRTESMIISGQARLPLDAQEWRTIEKLTREIDYKKVIGGDTGDPHSVWVGRFVNDVERPEYLHSSAKLLESIIMSAKMQSFYSEILQSQAKLCLRRCQANILKQGDFIGYHNDRDTTPDYLATVVLHLHEAEHGGEFVSYHPQLGQRSVKPSQYSLLLNSGDIPHEVLPVKQGERKTLACFLSANFGKTSKQRSQIQTV